MDPLNWTGGLGTFLDPILFVLVPIFAVLLVARVIISAVLPPPVMQTNPDGTLKAVSGGLPVLLPKLSNGVGLLLLAVVLVYLLGGAALGAKTAGIIGGISHQLVPVWVSLVVLFVVSSFYKRRLGLYGKLFDSTIGMIGFALVMFWVFVGIYAHFDLLITHDPLVQVSGMKNKPPAFPYVGRNRVIFTGIY